MLNFLFLTCWSVHNTRTAKQALDSLLELHAPWGTCHLWYDNKTLLHQKFSVYSNRLLHCNLQIFTEHAVYLYHSAPVSTTDTKSVQGLKATVYKSMVSHYFPTSEVRKTEEKGAQKENKAFPIIRTDCGITSPQYSMTNLQSYIRSLFKLLDQIEEAPWSDTYLGLVLFSPSFCLISLHRLLMNNNAAPLLLKCPTSEQMWQICYTIMSILHPQTELLRIKCSHSVIASDVGHTTTLHQGG